MHDLEKIIIHDAGNMEENTLPGDVIVTIQTAEHSIFKRNHNHLLTTIHLNYYEACIGFNKIIHYLDGTQLNINYSTHGQTIQPSSIYKIINYGLPINENPFVRGNLYIQFIIQLPNNIDNSNHIVEYFETQPFIDHSHNNKNEDEERQLLFPQVITDLTLSTMDEYIKEDISSSHTQQQDDHNNKYEPGNSNHPPNCQSM
jgi:DnaJ-class molecular chaperone